MRAPTYTFYTCDATITCDICKNLLPVSRIDFVKTIEKIENHNEGLLKSSVGVDFLASESIKKDN